MAPFQKKTEFFQSSDGLHRIRLYAYQGQDQAPKAVIQLCHGMAEYVERYEPMIQWYVDRGFAVCGNDHLGHGQEAEETGSLGFFAEKEGWTFVLQDLKTVNEWIHAAWPGVPVFFYGHSMGSFFARLYAFRWPETIRGAVFSGTAGPGPVNGAGKALASVIASVRGPRFVSPFLVKANMGHYLDRIQAPVNEDAWLTRDEEVCRAYLADPLCGFPFTASAYRDMLTVLCQVSGKAWFQGFPKDLPVLLAAGGMDPVGGYGEGVRKVFSGLISAGLTDLTCQIWPEDRHEIHNELDREEVFRFITGWLEERLDGGEKPRAADGRPESGAGQETRP